MLYNDNVNQNSSTIKTNIDTWYEENLLDYTKYLEDTIYCVARTQSNPSSNGLNPNRGDITTFIFFDVTGLNCNNDVDKYSVKNPKAKLTYPVGLMGYKELEILGNANIRKTGSRYWTGSPAYFIESANIKTMYTYNFFVENNATSTEGVRPSISLKSNTKYLFGEGSVESPYIINLKEYYGINVEIVDEIEDLNIQITDLTKVEEGEEVNFKVTPIKGFKVKNIKIIDEENNEVDFNTTDNKNYTFTMPETGVTIIPSYEKVKNAVEVEDNKSTKELIIEVNDATAVVYEDTVKFTLVPEDGYEVEDIDIRDKDNNKIEYTKTNKDNEYMFIMPDTDVVIKPVYRKLPDNNKKNNILINPKTGEKLYILLSLMSIIAIGTLFYRKIVELKN